MGYVQEARENHVKKKVEEGIIKLVVRLFCLNPNRPTLSYNFTQVCTTFSKFDV